MTPELLTLDVSLNNTRVGVLSGRPGQGSRFRLIESYRAAYPRPVLGQRFLDSPDDVWKVRIGLPWWFANLLPEGALRALLVTEAAVAAGDDFALLRLLGSDLSGAVRLSMGADDDAAWVDGPTDESAGMSGDGAWHFSLAGVQLKFPARGTGHRLTIPASGVGGDWIVKLADARCCDVPDNEFATMQWAKRSGIEVPETRLIDAHSVEGLPTALVALGPRVYAIRRFDRAADGNRIHIEDFAQVLGLHPAQKYQRHGYETIARIVAALAGEDGLREFIRRLVFVVASGNGDAHHKNWSLIYPDGVSTRLSPAYDLVSTIQYLPDERLALNLSQSKEWGAVSMASFARLARKINWPESAVRAMAEEAVDAVMTVWAASKYDVGYPAAMVDRLEQHMREVPLFNSAQ